MLTRAFMQSSVRNDDRMTKFSRKSIMTVYQFSVGNYSASNTGSKCYHDEVFHTLGGAIHHLADCGSVCIIGENDGQLEFFFEHLRKWNDAFPWEVRCVFNRAGIIVTIRGTY